MLRNGMVNGVTITTQDGNFPSHIGDSPATCYTSFRPLV
jgi:hypothetical protein